MIYITQLIYIKLGQEKVFDEFEAVAIPIIAKYNGKLLLRIRPNKKSYIETNIENPYEIHIVTFDSDNDLEGFMKDEDRQKLVHLKDQSIEKVVLIKGNKV